MRGDEPIRVGIVGFGHAGCRHHAPAFAASSKYELLAVAEPIDELRDQAIKFGVDHRFRSIEEMLQGVELDCVSVCTPPSSHLENIEAAAEHGANIICEKPIATTIEDARVIIDVVRSIDFSMVHNYMCLPEIQCAVAEVVSGAIGPLRHVDLTFMGVQDLPGVEGFDPLWRHSKLAAGGGVLMDMIHVVYLAQMFVGPIREVTGNVHHHEGAEVEDHAACFLVGDRGTATINIAWGHGRGGISILGRDGRIDCRYIDDGTPPFAGLEEVVVVTAAGARIALGPPARSTPMDLRHREFFDHLAGEGPTRFTSAAAGLSSLETVLGVYESAAKRVALAVGNA